VKLLVLYIAKRVFRALPLSDAQRKQMVFSLFRLTGDRLKFLPSYQLYKREALWQNAPIPADLSAYRTRIMAQYITEQGEALPVIVMISHTLGGGTQQHVEDMSAAMQAEGWRVFQLERHNQTHLHLFAFGQENNPLFYHWPEEIPALKETLKTLGVQHLHLHHTVDLPADFLTHFPAMSQAMGASYDFTVHDYFAICPRFTLYDDAVRSYCGEPEDARKCTACVSRFGSHVGNDIDVVAWRKNYAALLMAARKVFVPDSDIALRLARYLPEREFTIHPHHEAHHFTPMAAKRKLGEPLKVVTIGGIAPHKGSNVIYECAQDALARNLPIEFHLVGYSDIDHKLKSLKNVTVTGHFKLHELPQKLKEGGYHLAYLPAVWPETYNYVLSECWRHGFYTVGLDIGAIASRLKAAPTLGKVLPLEDYLKPAKLNDALLAMEIPSLDQLVVFAALTHYTHFTRDYYGL
jgi:glycosyltransferase involved in cell wall biosynthesis